MGYEDVVCQLVAANTRMTEKVIGQLGSVMTGVAELIAAAKDAGITSRPPPPLAIEVVEPEETEPPATILEQLTPLIQQAIPFVFEVLAKARANGATIAGMPIEAFVDWRAAAPHAQVVDQGEPASGASSTAPQSGVTATASSAPVPPGVVSGPTTAGAAPSQAASSSPSDDEKAAAVNAHVLQIVAGLQPAERARASQLVARLTPQERGAWLAELARLSVPEAIARARSILTAHSSPTAELPAAQPPAGPPSHNLNGGC